MCPQTGREASLRKTWTAYRQDHGCKGASNGSEGCCMLPELLLTSCARTDSGRHQMAIEFIGVKTFQPINGLLTHMPCELLLVGMNGIF